MPAASAPTHAFHALSFSDVVQQANAFDSWDVRYAQLSPGHYQGAIERVDLGTITLMREHTDLVVTQMGSAGRNAYVFGVAVQSDEGARFNGHTWSGTIAATGRGREFCVRTHNTSMLLLEVDAETLEDVVATSCERSLNNTFRHGACLFEQASSTGRFTQAVGEWIAHAATSSMSTSWQQAAQRELLDVLSEVLSAQASEDWPVRMADANRVSIVNRALDYMHAHIDESMQVIDICAALRVSRRTLQSCFQSVMGINPQQFLRAHRLSLVRNDLLRADPSRQIKDVVEKWGFWHLSRFADSYRKQFGELPSTTIQRTKLTCQ